MQFCVTAWVASFLHTVPSRLQPGSAHTQHTSRDTSASSAESDSGAGGGGGRRQHRIAHAPPPTWATPLCGTTQAHCLCSRATLWPTSRLMKWVATRPTSLCGSSGRPRRWVGAACSCLSQHAQQVRWDFRSHAPHVHLRSLCMLATGLHAAGFAGGRHAGPRVGGAAPALALWRRRRGRRCAFSSKLLRRTPCQLAGLGSAPGYRFARAHCTALCCACPTPDPSPSRPHSAPRPQPSSGCTAVGSWNIWEPTITPPPPG